MKTNQVVSFLLVLALGIILLTACGSTVGDHMVTKYDQVKLVSDWNAITYDKPVSCVLPEGTEVEVVDVSTLIRGSSDHEMIYQVKTLDGSCVGWGFPDFFKSP